MGSNCYVHPDCLDSHASPKLVIKVGSNLWHADPPGEHYYDVLSFAFVGSISSRV